MAIQIQMRRGTEALWTSVDPTLANGEWGYEDDTNKIKIGDGSTAWSSLPYFAGGGSGTVTSVATSNGTFVNVSGGTITTSGTITGDLSATGTASSATFLRGDNTWAEVSGSGTVTSVDVSGGSTGLTFIGGPITTSGTITVGGVLNVVNGGLGFGAADKGDLIYGYGEDQWARLPIGAEDQVLSIGNDDWPRWTTSSGSGTVTSVATSNGTFVNVTGGTITTTGTVTADLSATGTASSTTFLRGDNRWATPPGGGGGGTMTWWVSDGSDSFEVEDSDTVFFTSNDGSVDIDASYEDYIDFSVDMATMTWWASDGADSFEVSDTDTVFLTSNDGSVDIDTSYEDYIDFSVDMATMTWWASDGSNSFEVEDTDTVQFTSNDSSIIIDASYEDYIDFAVDDPSDERLKKNIKPLERGKGFEVLEQLKPVAFEWKKDSGRKGKAVGLIAQDVEKILPELVTENRKGIKRLQYDKLVPFLIDAIIDLKEDVADLKKRLAEVEQR